MKLILASNSPQRKELFEKAGYKFDVVGADYQENEFSCDPIITAETFALGKAKAVYDSLADKNALVVGADTVVYLDEEILGKAKDEKQAIKMLKSLSGRTHKVITGYALVGAFGCQKGHTVTEVTFNVLSSALIKDYIDSGLYKGKAGSYGIQDDFPLVKEYVGSLDNVIGFPTETVFPIINNILNR